MGSLKIRVLYVEDSPDDQLILKRSLTEKLPIDLDLVTVETAMQGLKKLEKENFDIIIFDYRLPDMTGIELLQEINSRNIKTPAILVTSKGSEHVAVNAMKLGVRDYITKEEITSERLVNTLREILIESSLPETVDAETAKQLAILFDQNPTIQIESACSLISTPKSEIPAQKLVPTLKTLEAIKAVTAEPSRSIVACPECESTTTTFYIECPECESTKMIKGEALEHFDCGNIDFRSNYEKGDGISVCPKCGKKLKIIGVDYRKIENWYRCSNNHFYGQPNFTFACSMCNEKFTLDKSNIQMLHNYKITNSGRHTLKLGLKVSGMTKTNKKENSSQKT